MEAARSNFGGGGTLTSITGTGLCNLSCMSVKVTFRFKFPAYYLDKKRSTLGKVFDLTRRKKTNLGGEKKKKNADRVMFIFSFSPHASVATSPGIKTDHLH